jgi:hypothetical protein
MRLIKIRSSFLVVLIAIACCVATREQASAELHWQDSKKEHLKIRLVALAIAYPRSSFFSSQEIFVAEQEIEKDETRLVKLVYNFLPYQPRLSEYGLEYSTAHEIKATRDPSCDERLNEMGRQGSATFKYSADSPVLDLDHRRFRLRCYQTTAEDYDKPLH